MRLPFRPGSLNSLDIRRRKRRPVRHRSPGIRQMPRHKKRFSGRRYTCSRDIFRHMIPQRRPDSACTPDNRRRTKPPDCRRSACTRDTFPHTTRHFCPGSTYSPDRHRRRTRPLYRRSIDSRRMLPRTIPQAHSRTIGRSARHPHRRPLSNRGLPCRPCTPVTSELAEAQL
jgi:hypothetical protein